MMTIHDSCGCDRGVNIPPHPSPKGRLTAFSKVVTINWYADNFSNEGQRKKQE
jgi:hypothetical protein